MAVGQTDFLRAHRILTPRIATGHQIVDVAKAYNFVDVDCSKRHVAILEFGGFYDPRDIIKSAQDNGVKPAILRNFFLDGSQPVSDPNGADGEVALDIEIVQAIAPGCQIDIIFAENSEKGFADAVQLAYSLNVDGVSNSWGAPESQWSDVGRNALDRYLKACIETGITPFSAMGDSQADDGTMKKVTDYPASSRYCIGAGGTRLELNPDGTRSKETVWGKTGLFSSGEGTGGGISKLYPQPEWQAGLLPDQAPGRRCPDISGNADPATGWFVWLHGSQQTYGGTSAVAPMLAGWAARNNAAMGKHIGFLAQKIYAAPASCFYDVTEGSNGYPAGEGFDLCTGRGVVDGAQFLAYLQGKLT